MRSLPTIAAVAASLALACSQGGDAAPSLTMPSRAGHAQRWFPIVAGTPHATATCDDCHGAFDTFAKFDCIHCHTGDHADEAALTTRHGAVPGFQFASEACYGCHQSGVGVDHAKLFPIVAGTAHATAGCAECHVDPANRRTLGCAGCHDHEQAAMATAHAAVPDYAFDSARCVRCHAEAQVDRVAAHLPFGIAPGLKHSGSRAACLTCHPATRADKAWAADFAVKDCLACHGDTETTSHHTQISGYAWATEACIRCHPTGVN